MSLRALAAALPKLTRPALGKRGRVFATLVGEWPGIVGASLADDCVPEKLGWPPGGDRDAVLTLRVRSGAAIELQHIAPQLIERINTFLGFAAVARLRFVHAPLRTAPKPSARRHAVSAAEAADIAARVQGIDDPALKTALEALGRGIVGRKPR